MDVNFSNCIHCRKRLHYSEARLLPGGGGVCQTCAKERGYVPCEECQDYFIPDGEQCFCEICFSRIFAEF